MEECRWDFVILEWVNCLLLTKPVKKLKDLCDGKFFEALLKLLWPETFSEVSEDIIHLLYKFLRKHYPDFNIEIERSNLKELNEIDVIEITSLLLHYSCITDRRSCLTEPLCNNLSSDLQIIIRTFLELFPEKIDQNSFKSFIRKSFKVSNDQIVQLKSPLSYGSPLKEFLRTPTSKVHFKDRELKKLRDEIELEKFEKADLQEELRAHQEKIEKIAEQLKEKSKEVSRLRSELVDLENKENVCSQKERQYDLQRRYQSEIQHLEKYVTQLEDEQNLLQDERDNLKKKLKNSESNLKQTQEKLLMVESNYESLLEKCELQEREIKNLKFHCNEINTMLSELKQKPNESYLETDNSHFDLNHQDSERDGTFSEDLACAVVEVQLKDSMKENIELKVQLKETESKNLKLNEEIKLFEGNYNDLSKNFADLQRCNDELMKKVILLEVTQEELHDTRSEVLKLSKFLDDATNKNCNLTEENSVLSLKLNDANANFEELKKDNKRFEIELLQMKLEYEKLNCVLEEKQKIQTSLECEHNKLQYEYNLVLEKYNNTQFDLETLSNKFTLFNNEMETCLRNLEKIVYGKNECVCLKDKNLAFNDLIDKLQLNISSDVNNRKSLETRNCELEFLVETLQGDISKFEEREVLSLKERDELNVELKIAKEQTCMLDKILQDHSRKIKDLTDKISVLNCTIEDLENLNKGWELEVKRSVAETNLFKQQLKEKSSAEEVLNQKITELSKALKSKENKIMEQHKDFERASQEISNLKAKEQKILNEKTNLEVIIQQLEQNKLEEIKCLNNEIDLIECKINKLEDGLSIANSTMEQKSRKRYHRNEEKYYEINSCKEHIITLTEKIDVIGKTINKIKMELHSTIEEKNKFEKSLEEEKNSSKELNEIKDRQLMEIQSLKEETIKLMKNLDTKNKKLENLREKYNQETKQLQQELQSKSLMILDLETQTGKQTKKIESLKIEVVSVKNDLNSITSDFDVKNRKFIEDIQKLKDELESKSSFVLELEANLEKVNKDIVNSQSCIEILEEENSDLNAKIEDFQKQIQMLYGLKMDYEEDSHKLKKEINRLNERIATRNEEFTALETKMNEYKNSVENEIETLKREICKKHKEIEEICKQKNALVLDYEDQIIRLNSEIANLTSATDGLREKEIEYLQEIRYYKDELSQTINKYTESLQLQQEKTCEYESQISMLTENLHELVEKYNNLDKVHNELCSNLDVNKIALEKMEKQNMLLENKLAEEKQKFKLEFEEMKEQLKDEVKNLAEERKYIEEKVKSLITELDESKEKNLEKEEAIKDALEKLNIVELERLALTERISSLEELYEHIKKDRGAISELLEKSTSESNSALEKLKSEFKIKIDSLEDEKAKVEGNLQMATARIAELEMGMKEKLVQHQLQIQENEDVLKKMNFALETCKKSIENVEKEKSVLVKTIEQERNSYTDLKKQFEEKSQKDTVKIQEQENLITKLKCQNALVETGKEKLQNKYDKLLMSMSKLQDDMAQKEEIFQGEAKLKESEMNNLKSLVQDLKKECEHKQVRIDELKQNLDLLATSVETLKGDKSSVQKSLMDMEENYKEKLSEIRSDFKLKLEEKESSYSELKSKYDASCLEIDNIKLQNNDLVLKINDLIESKKELEHKIEDKEEILLQYEENLSLRNTKIIEQEKELKEVNDILKRKLDLIESTLKEKAAVECDLIQAKKDLEYLRISRDEILESQAKITKEIENKALQEQKRVNDMKEKMLRELEKTSCDLISEKELRKKVEELLQEEKNNKDVLNLCLIKLENEKSKMELLNSELKCNIKKIVCLLQELPTCSEVNLDDVDCNSSLDLSMAKIESKIIKIFEKKRELTQTISKLEIEQKQIKEELDNVRKEYNNVVEEKKSLMETHDLLYREKSNLELSSKESETKLDVLQKEINSLTSVRSEVESQKKFNFELKSQIEELKEKNQEKIKNYQQLLNINKQQKEALERMLAEKNNLEELMQSLRQDLLRIQEKSFFITEDSQYKSLFEQKQSLEIIIDDISKQYTRISKQLANTSVILLNSIEKTVLDILSEKSIPWESLFIGIIPEGLPEKLEDCKDSTASALEQLKNFESAVKKVECKLEVKSIKTQKENVLQAPKQQNVDLKMKEEEWRKKNFALKQRLTLAENAKNNFEKKLKQVREENKKLAERCSNIDNDIHYKTLLQQYIQTKQDLEKKVEEYSNKCTALVQELEDHKKSSTNQESLSLSEKFKLDEKEYKLIIEGCNKRYEDLVREFEEYKINNSNNDKIMQDLQVAKEAYEKVLYKNSKLELDLNSAKKMLDDCNGQLREMSIIKEAYEKLLEENNKLMTQVDTIKYKRNRDREEFIRLLRKEKEDCESNENKKIQEIRSEYEGKLERMKEKMIRLYKTEMNKGKQKASVEIEEFEILSRTVDDLKEELKEALSRIQKLDREKKAALDDLKNLQQQMFLTRRESEMFPNRESVSISSRDFDRRLHQSDYSLSNMGASKPKIPSTNVGISQRMIIEERKIATLPRNLGMDIIEEVSSKRTAIKTLPADIGQNLEMEDEGELFNNKYLADLKEGRCIPSFDRETISSRMSELARRNSLYPPHLKSSYPAETQFATPTHFKDEDIKAGNIEFDDSMSSRLLPNEKHRKKDLGTTSYKRPGPPTPSKNGGRVSLQGNDNHPLREQNESKTPKKSTPGRLKSFLMGRNSSVRDGTENHPPSPSKKRLSIFRKPR